ncbi:MAG: cbb3-type cytochrome c oxidase N-terminal domain-containing protein [Acidobacteriota bacterium]|nr:cbb3-type cytochrome c oxidase N-terminal domain-containing protein [Acidobacteriota bacterium]
MTDKPVEHSHDFDGIVELDNDLPRWWLGIFWVTTIVAVFYVPYYHFMYPEKLPEAALLASQEARAEELAKIEAAKPKPVDEEADLLAKYNAGGWEEAAKADFTTFCVPCHAPDGGGTIGPNFTDDYYIHGGKLTDIRRIIVEGVPAKGMISWKVSLKPQQIENLTFYIRSLRGTTPATPKAAEGKLVDEAGNFTE